MIEGTIACDDGIYFARLVWMPHGGKLVFLKKRERKDYRY
jgi:hypothetical protein